MSNRIKTRPVRIGKGYVEVSNKLIYSDLILDPTVMGIQLRMFVPKGMSISYASNSGWKYNTTKKGQTVLLIWFSLDGRLGDLTRGQNINQIVAGLIDMTHLNVFEEDRKWLTEEEKSDAKMYALKTISIGDVEWLLGKDACDLPQAWHDYVKEYGAGYDAYIDRKERECREIAGRLNTPEGLRYMLNAAKQFGEHTPAVSFMEQLKYDLTNLYDK